MMNGWDMMDGVGGGGFWMAAAMVAITLVVVTGIWLILRSNRPRQDSAPTPVEILRQRFAKGEISNDEFETARRALGG